MSKKKSKKSDIPPEDAEKSGNGKSAAANGADRIGEHPHPAANGNGRSAEEDMDADFDADFEESMEMLPDRIRKQLESIRKRFKQARDLSREARDNYETARKTLEKMREDSEIRMKRLEEKVQQQSEDYRESNLRLRAEAENIRKRSAEQLENLRKYAVETFADGVCEIRDCLEAAMESDPETPQAMREGVKLTLRKLASVMDAHGIRPVNPDIGANFDPVIHQAVAKSADSPQPTNTIAVVVRKGYTIHQRTLRPADVIVSISPTHSHPPHPPDSPRSENPAPSAESAAKSKPESARKSGGKKGKSGKSA